MEKISEAIKVLSTDEKDQFLYELLDIFFRLPKNESTVKLWWLIDSWMYTIAVKKDEKFYKKITELEKEIMNDLKHDIE
ncbi:MAG: hypothetical protein GX957_09565 [Clostridiaceae bacterium]|nr:hypothetical protein [Clostridiaceae bacterium]